MIENEIINTVTEFLNNRGIEASMTFENKDNNSMGNSTHVLTVTFVSGDKRKFKCPISMGNIVEKKFDNVINNGYSRDAYTIDYFKLFFEIR